jgi:hypothetical protein
MSDVDHDAGIPVLTEIVSPGIPLRQTPASLEAAATRPEASALPRPQDITEIVLLQLQERINALLETHIRDCIDTALSAVTSRLAAEISDDVQQAVTQLVSDAVTQEIEKHDFHKTKI